MRARWRRRARRRWRAPRSCGRRRRRALTRCRRAWASWRAGARRRPTRSWSRSCARRSRRCCSRLSSCARAATTRTTTRAPRARRRRRRRRRASGRSSRRWRRSSPPPTRRRARCISVVPTTRRSCRCRCASSRACRPTWSVRGQSSQGARRTRRRSWQRCRRTLAPTSASTRKKSSGCDSRSSAHLRAVPSSRWGPRDRACRAAHAPQQRTSVPPDWRRERRLRHIPLGMCGGFCVDGVATRHHLYPVPIRFRAENED
mmetsp:Transcript_45726/g.126957  ORF Transcript_45726/g.126957 Transcript_45726/m.126957 type:complete len:259 (-) Transcript_45726:8-784(-)